MCWCSIMFHSWHPDLNLWVLMNIFFAVGTSSRGSTWVREWRSWHQEPTGRWKRSRSHAWRRTSHSNEEAIVGSVFISWRRQRKIRVPRLLQALYPPAIVKSSHEMSLRCQTLLVHILRKRLQRHLRLEAAHKNSHWRSSLQVQSLREVFHSAMLLGVALPEGSRRATSICLQGKTYKGNLKNIFIFLKTSTNFQFPSQMYVCEECGHTTNEPEVHYIHLKDKHPYSPALLKFYDKRHFKFTNSQFANNLLGSFPMPVHN